MHDISITTSAQHRGEAEASTAAGAPLPAPPPSPSPGKAAPSPRKKSSSSLSAFSFDLCVRSSTMFHAGPSRACQAKLLLLEHPELRLECLMDLQLGWPQTQ